ncbi:MAG TPA: PIN domain-containing protein [Streptosporangiaceae bacterium]
MRLTQPGPAGIESASGLIIPILVIQELDGLKQDRRRAGERARYVLRRLWELGGRAPAQAAAMPATPPGSATIEVWLDDPWHVRRPVNDEEIVERAKTLAEMTGREVVLAAGDYC